MYAVPALKFVKNLRSAANPNAGFIVQLIKYQNIIGLKKNNENDTDNDNDNDNQSNEEEEEKAEQPTKKNNDDDGSKSLTKRLNSPMVKEWENGRRPSLFTALAKLRGMKNRARANSTDSKDTNISPLLQPNDNNNINNNNIPSPPISPLDDGGAAKLQLLKEVSNETDDDYILSAEKEDVNLDNISKHIALDTSKCIDDDDVITPLEDYNDGSFPAMNIDENKGTHISSTQL